MYSYYRDNAQVQPMQDANVLPVQNTGLMPMQNVGMMPMQNAGMMPMQNAGLMPMQNPCMMPMPNVGMMPMQNAGMMPMPNAYDHTAVSPEHFNQFAEMPTEDLENLYPQTYKVIQPAVENVCDKWMGKHGEKCPSKAEYDSLVSDIYNKVESDVEAAIKNSPVADERQFFGGSRRLLRDFIGAVLIGSLIRRRRRPFFWYPFYGSYVYPFY
jgi:hypothetical protein